MTRDRLINAKISVYDMATGKGATCHGKNVRYDFGAHEFVGRMDAFTTELIGGDK